MERWKDGEMEWWNNGKMERWDGGVVGHIRSACNSE
jgi:hypothetical protein